MKSATWLRFGIGAALLAGVAACSNLTGSGSAPRTASVAPTPVASAPVAPEMVRQVQSKLRDGGYYQQGAIDGVWGSGTETAVKNFQRDHNLETSGKLDVPTLQAMNLTGSAPATQPVAPDRAGVTTPPPAGSTAPVERR
jgi:peptidoglycan hydrolase-like protein with peptidoglycan-binding domain